MLIAGAIASIVAFIAILYVARKLIYQVFFNPSDTDVSPTGFTLTDLRDLHRAGKMSDEEFEKAKTTLIQAAKESAGKPPLPRS